VVGIVHVHAKSGVRFEDGCADPAADLRRSQEEGFVRAPGPDLEGPGRALKRGRRGASDGIQIGRTALGKRKISHAEDPADPFGDPPGQFVVQPAGRGGGNVALGAPPAKIGQIREPVPQVPEQLFFEHAAVTAFEADLGGPDDDRVEHNFA